jgi:arylsulfatase A-like enzyme
VELVDLMPTLAELAGLNDPLLNGEFEVVAEQRVRSSDARSSVHVQHSSIARGVAPQRRAPDPDENRPL